jgi:CBS domain-containing protein
MQARELMTSDPFVVTPRESIWRAAEIMRDLDIGMVPVVDDAASNHLQGVITDRDIAVRCVARKHGISCTVGDHMTTDHLVTVSPDAASDDVLAEMERAQVRRVLVISGDNHLDGVIAQADVAIKLGRVEPVRVEKALERLSARHAEVVS